MNDLGELRRENRALRDRPGAFTLGELRVRYDQRRVTVAGREVELTATVYDLLRVLSQNAGRALTHDRLLRGVWGKRGDDADSPAYIRTERNVGYRMPEPESGGGP